MSSISSVEARLPPGFRFHPKDEELICDYLMKWVNGCPCQNPLLIQVDLNKCEPWDIPEIACVGGKEWYFYNQRDRKYTTGLRKNRATVSGYWKATGKDRPVTKRGSLVGMRKTLVFYKGRAPKGRKTQWVMHEFRLESGTTRPGPKVDSSVKEDWVLCRMFYKNKSELHPSSQETVIGPDEITSSPPSALPGLIKPQVTYDQIHQSNTDTDHFHNQQVPCFSIYNSNPNFPFVAQMDPSQILPASTKTIPSYHEIFQYPNDPPSLNSSNSYDDDRKMSKDVLNCVTKVESEANGLINTCKKGSFSFGEGIPDSYFSEMGLSYMWNH